MAPRIGLKLAWRQNFSVPWPYSGLPHRHSTALYPLDDREYLEDLCASVNEGYRLKDGRGSIVQWVESYDSDSDTYCGGNYWGVRVEKKERP